MHSIVEYAHDLGMVVGVSDPVWKQLGDFGCCCGINPKHPVFGNWQREQATNALITARDTGRIVNVEDVIPPWAYKTSSRYVVAFSAGPEQKIKGRRELWSDKLLENYNGLNKQRGILNYFQGALAFAGWDKQGNATYRYEGLKRKHPERTPYWKVTPNPV